MRSTGDGRTTVLLVAHSESDADLFESIVETAAPASFDVARAATLAAAAAYLATAAVDCAVVDLVDLGVPDAEGLALVAALATRAPTVALVALTESDDAERGAAVVAAGANDYLAKHALDGRSVVRCIRFAALEKRFEFFVAEARRQHERTESVIADQAFHDPLTGLPNRLLLLDRMREALERSGDPSNVGAIYFDVDRFTAINSSLGYPIGDQLLRLVATRLAGLARPGDTLARIGSDEFAMLCEGLTGEADAIDSADKICAAMTSPVEFDGGELVIAVSAGIAIADSASVSPDSLLTDAQAAVFRAKREGRARSAVFAPSMRATAIERLDTEVSLRQSLVDGDLRLHYQPIVNLADGQVLGHEALVRWDHPTRGLIGPDHFIDIAEESGLIVPLGAWVLQEACRQAKRFQARDARWARLTMSVNLSGRQLGQPDLVDLIASALRDADLRPEHLQLEMTEGILMDDAAATIGILSTLKALGVRLDVDDFGTGYSSLAYLKRFPVDVLKIDHSFVHDLGKHREDSAIVGAVVTLADALGFTVIAEGVETALQRDSLVDLGCSRAQGYFFARPVEASEAETALDHSLSRHSARRVEVVGEPLAAVCHP